MRKGQRHLAAGLLTVDGNTRSLGLRIAEDLYEPDLGAVTVVVNVHLEAEGHLAMTISYGVRNNIQWWFFSLQADMSDLIWNGPASVDGGVAVVRPKSLLQKIVLEVVAGQWLAKGGTGEQEEHQEHGY